MLQIAFGIILAIILIAILPYIFAFLVQITALVIVVGIAAAIFFGSYFVLREIIGEEIDIGTFIALAVMAAFVASMLYGLVSSIWNLGGVIRNLGGVQNTLRYCLEFLMPAFTEQQRLKKARAKRATFEKGAAIKRERENAHKSRIKERAAAERQEIEKITEYVEATLRSKLSLYLQDGIYQIVRNSVRHVNILIKTDAGNLVASIENHSAKVGWTLSTKLSVYGENKSNTVGEELGVRSAAKMVLKLVRNHAAAQIDS